MPSEGTENSAHADFIAEPKFNAHILEQADLPMSPWYQPFRAVEPTPRSNGSEAVELPVSFRELIPCIPSTTYGTFGLYRYPAKFIPQVVAYAIQQYGAQGMRVLDPFAGSGTTRLVARLFRLPYELWDLNPLLEVLHAIAIMRPTPIDIPALIARTTESSHDWLPQWSNLNYWYPDETIPFLGRVWGFYHSQEDDYTRKLLTVPLLKVTRAFSFNDPQRQKLSRSPKALRRVQTLLTGDWQTRFIGMLQEETLKVLQKLYEYRKLMITGEEVPSTVRTGADTLDLAKSYTDRCYCWDMLITSPPYLQAQEYIRCSKMDLFWLGHSEEQIRHLSKQELPYKQVAPIPIHAETYEKHRNAIQEVHLQQMYERYFYAVLGALTQLAERVSTRLCLFVGPATVRGQSIPIDRIFTEHFTHLGWQHESTLIDTIAARVMFRSHVNPATGIEDKRMPTEHLVILRR